MCAFSLCSFVVVGVWLLVFLLVYWCFVCFVGVSSPGFGLCCSPVLYPVTVFTRFYGIVPVPNKDRTLRKTAQPILVVLQRFRKNVTGLTPSRFLGLESIWEHFVWKLLYEDALCPPPTHTQEKWGRRNPRDAGAPPHTHTTQTHTKRVILNFQKYVHIFLKTVTGLPHHVFLLLAHFWNPITVLTPSR